jgi:hypothetical protein
MKILQEAHHTYKLLSNDSIDTTVLVYDFQDYWQGANESISSLYSRLHFGLNKDFVRLSRCEAISMHQEGDPTRPMGCWTDRTPRENSRQ